MGRVELVLTEMEEGCCRKGKGPGYPSPNEAQFGPREKIIYIQAIYTGTKIKKPDYLATVDVNVDSETYGQIIHRLPMNHLDDELHHSGWNACSSCHSDGSAQRRFLILPSFMSSRIYIIDTVTDPLKPSIHKVVEPDDIIKKTGLAFPHTAHCLPTGDVMVSCLGDKEGSVEGSAGFLLLDGEFDVKGRWEEKGHSPPLGYDFWYQPRFKTMISSSWAPPSSFTKGYNPADVAEGLYGKELYIYEWPGGKLKQTLDLGKTGLVPFELRFLHDPNKPTGFVGCALSGTMVRFFMKVDFSWDHQVVITVPNLKVKNWILPEIPGLITDFLISLDDRFLYFSNWLHGDIRQYNIEDPTSPVLVGQVWVGGSFRKISNVFVEKEGGELWQSDVPDIQGKKLRGGPQMIQLSLDGKRLYASNSLYSVWDKQFYPDLVEQGSHMLLIDVDNEKGGLSINQKFFVDFGDEPDGPALAHEMRYPGGDCTSDIWI